MRKKLHDLILKRYFVRFHMSLIVAAVTLSGVTASQAEVLVGGFTSACPIYNTLKRGGPVEISWTVS